MEHGGEGEGSERDGSSLRIHTNPSLEDTHHPSLWGNLRIHSNPPPLSPQHRVRLLSSDCLDETNPDSIHSWTFLFLVKQWKQTNSIWFYGSKFEKFEKLASQTQNVGTVIVMIRWREGSLVRGSRPSNIVWLCFWWKWWQWWTVGVGPDPCPSRPGPPCPSSPSSCSSSSPRMWSSPRNHQTLSSSS